MPGTILRRVGLVRAGAETDALRVAMSVGEDARIEALWRVVAGHGLAVPVDAQHLAADAGRALRHLAVVGVARRHIQEAVRGTEAEAPAIMRAGIAEGMVAGRRLVGDVGDDILPVRDLGQIRD